MRCLEKCFHLYKNEFLLFIFWLVSQFILSNYYGIRIANDSRRYIALASQLAVDGDIVFGKHFWYIGYIGFLALCFKAGFFFSTIITLQVVLNGLSCLALGVISNILFKNKKISYVVIFFYILFIELHSFSYYILTESFYISMLIFSFLIMIQGSRLIHYLIIAPFLLITSLIRPSGCILFTSFFLFLMTSYWPLIKKNKYIFYSLVFIFFSAGLFLLNIILKNFNIVNEYAKGETIFRYSSAKLSVNGVWIPSSTEEPLIQFVQFVFYNPLFFSKLVCFKLYYFFIHAKPYYSFYHNVYILSLLCMVYVFAFFGFLKSKIKKQVLVFICLFIVLQAAMVGLTVEDWDGRFLMPLFPFLSLFAGAGCFLFFVRFRKIITKRMNPTR